MTDHNSIFNPINSNRIEEINETIVLYENTINELKKLLEQKENYAFDKFVRSENTLEYFKNLLSKYTVESDDN